MNEAGKLRGEGFRCCGALWYDPPSLPARRPWVQQVDDATHGVKGLDAACCEHRPPQPTVAGEASRPHHFWPAWPRWWCWQATRARNRKEAFTGSVTTLPRTISRAVAWPCDAQANFLNLHVSITGRGVGVPTVSCSFGRLLRPTFQALACVPYPKDGHRYTKMPKGMALARLHVHL